MRKFLTLLSVLVLLSALVYAQTKTITGRVTDQAGQPVPFATVRIKESRGTGKGVSADADGNYSIKVNPGATLIGRIRSDAKLYAGVPGLPPRW